MTGGDPVAVEDGHRQLGRTELWSRAAAVGHGLDHLGAGPGRHVAICVGNRVEFVEAVLGAWQSGSAYTPVKTGWTPTEIGVLLDDAKTAVMITDRDTARRAAADRGIPVLDLDAGYEPWLERQDSSPLPADRCGYKLPFTSGTTGRPKGVVMSGSGTTPFASAWAGIARYAEALGLPGDGVHLFASRLFNGAPQTFGFGALARGARLRIMPRWDAAEGLLALADPEVTSTIMVPTMFRGLLGLAGVDRTVRPAPGLVTVLHGGEPCPVAVKTAMLDWFGEVLVEYYGFTEGGMAIATAADWRARPGTVGRPLAGLTAEIRGPHGDALPPGQEGTVYFAMATGRRFHYAGDSDRTEAAHTGDAFTVGDIGWVDADGFLFLSGRSADVVVSAGVNIYPAEVEQALAAVAGIADLAAVGVPHPDRGEAIAVAIVLAGGADESVVRSALTVEGERVLAPYKRPQTIVVTQALPRDETGKLLRRVLRDDLRTILTGDR